MTLISQFDNRMDRTDTLTALGHLSPAARLAFLARMCSLVTPLAADVVRPNPKMEEQVKAAMRCDLADDMLTKEIWSNLWLLTSQYDLDPDRMVRELEAAARRVR